MYSRILVPLDGSAAAEQALPYARKLAQSFHAPIDLIQIVEPLPRELGADLNPQLHRHRNMELRRASAQTYLDRVRSQLQEAGLGASCLVSEGHVASNILDEAARNEGSIIVMSTHGRSGIARWVMGSTTDKVVRAANRPILAVHAPAQDWRESNLQLETVVVPLDGSTLAEQVLPHVAFLASAMELNVLLLHVMSNEDSVLEITAREYLQKVAENLQRQQVQSVNYRVIHGHPISGVISESAAKTSNAIIAMATHGHSGIMRWALGSVTSKVLGYSETATLVVRASH